MYKLLFILGVASVVWCLYAPCAFRRDGASSDDVVELPVLVAPRAPASGDHANCGAHLHRLYHPVSNPF